jgi:hypothetical protein
MANHKRKKPKSRRDYELLLIDVFLVAIMATSLAKVLANDLIPLLFRR